MLKKERMSRTLFFVPLVLFALMLCISPSYSASELQQGDLTPWAYLPLIRQDPAPAIIKIIYIYVPPNLPVAYEYVDIENQGGTPQEMTNWKLKDRDGNTCILAQPPNPSFTLQPGASVRVYSKYGSDNENELYCDSTYALWSKNGDTAYLYDQNDQLIDTYSY